MVTAPVGPKNDRISGHGRRMATAAADIPNLVFVRFLEDKPHAGLTRHVLAPMLPRISFIHGLPSQ